MSARTSSAPLNIINTPPVSFFQFFLVDVGRVASSQSLPLLRVFDFLLLCICRSVFRPMKHTLTKKEEKTLMKLVVHPTNNKVGRIYKHKPEKALKSGLGSHTGMS